MKQLTKLATMMIGLGLAQLSFGADWTPHLKGMQNSCNYGEKLTNILNKKTAMPKALKADVVKHTTTGNSESGGKASLSLKNATAFGYPINKITYEIREYGSSLTVHFKTTDFTKSIGNFTVKVGNQNQKAGIKKAWAVSSSGKVKSLTFPQKIDGIYDYDSLFLAFEDTSEVYITDEAGWDTMGAGEYGSSLTFDKQAKTISCNFG